MESKTLKRAKKVIVGTVIIKKYGDYNSLRGYFSKEFRDIIKSDTIVFDIREFKIRLPDIDSRKTTSIKSGYFGFVNNIYDPNVVIGKYNILQKNEDVFVLKKQHEQV